MKRTIPVNQDLAWMPRGYRAVRWGVGGGIIAGVASIFVLPAFFTGGHFNGGIAGVLPILSVSAMLAGDKAARRLMRSRLRALASGAVDLSRLPREADGELVHVSGTVRLREVDGVPQQVRGVVDPPKQGVWRRTIFGFDPMNLMLDEASVDFMLVGASGEAVLVETEAAHWLDDDVKAERIDGATPGIERLEELALRLDKPRVTKQVDSLRRRRAKGKKMRAISARESFLREGDAVEIVGYKSRTVDQSQGERLARDTPYRVTLRGGRELPLLIAPRRAK